MDEKIFEQLLDKQSKELKKDYASQGKFLLEQFDKKTSVIAEQFGSLKDKVDATFEMTGKLTEDMDIVRGELRIIRNNLSRKVDHEEFEGLEKKVIFLEKKLQKA